MTAMAPVPADHPLMIAWKAYQETEDFKNSLHWATTDKVMRQERADELGLVNRPADAEVRTNRAKGSLWAAFMAGFNVTASQWQPIETAPKDRTIIIMGRYPTGRAYVEEGEWNPARRHFRARQFEPPTHWMPMPEPHGGWDPVCSCCGGTGADPNTLNDPGPCPVCGVEYDPARDPINQPENIR